MINDANFYLKTLYPFQDKVIRILNQVETGFYLTGGTATSRGYLEHRFSDDLDYFVNDDSRFGLWVDRIIFTLSQEYKCDVLMREERFARFNLHQDNVLLKIEMINDVPSRVGDVIHHPILGRIDSPENILANKVTAVLDREAPKDLADIWGLCYKQKLSLMHAIAGAQGKAIGIFPADLARVLCSAMKEDWEVILWKDAPPVDLFISQLYKLGEDLLIP